MSSVSVKDSVEVEVSIDIDVVCSYCLKSVEANINPRTGNLEVEPCESCCKNSEEDL